MRHTLSAYLDVLCILLAIFQLECFPLQSAVFVSIGCTSIGYTVLSVHHDLSQIIYPGNYWKQSL